MIELILSRPVIVSLALLGAILSTGASIAHVRKALSDKAARVLNLAGYAAMGLSILLFILAGLLGDIERSSKRRFPAHESFNGQELSSPLPPIREARTAVAAPRVTRVYWNLRLRVMAAPMLKHALAAVARPPHSL